MRKVASSAVKIGAVAAIGGLAYNAYQNYQQGKAVVPQSVTNMLAEFTAPSGWRAASGIWRMDPAK